MAGRFMVQLRKKIITNTDPQRRCYNGCNFSEEVSWTEWEDFGAWETEELAENIRKLYANEPPHGREYRVVELQTEEGKQS